MKKREKTIEDLLNELEPKMNGAPVAVFGIFFSFHFLFLDSHLPFQYTYLNLIVCCVWCLFPLFMFSRFFFFFEDVPSPDMKWPHKNDAPVEAVCGCFVFPFFFFICFTSF